MESKNRRELALMQVERARKHYGTIDAKLTDLKHEIEWLEEFKPLSLDVEFEGENPTDKEIDKFLEKLERGDKC